MMSPVAFAATAMPASRRAPGTFQQRISASSDSACASGDAIRKNDPGLAAEKYARAASSDDGMFEPQFRASTTDVYTFAPSTPPITITASHNTMCLAMHSSLRRNLREAGFRRLDGTDIRGKQNAGDRSGLGAVGPRRQP